MDTNLMLQPASDLTNEPAVSSAAQLLLGRTDQECTSCVQGSCIASAC